MPSLNDIAYLIAEQMPQRNSPPGELLLSQLRQTVLHYRAVILRRDYSQNTKDVTTAKEILYLDTELVQEGQYTFKQSKVPVPEPIRLKSSGDFIYVGPADGLTNYTQVKKQELLVRKYNKFTGHTPCYVYEDNKLELHNVAITRIRVDSLFADPRETWAINNRLPVSFYDNTVPFPIPMDMVESLTAGILNGTYKLLTPPASEQAVVRP